jgi:SAM-dependent methyltransferase
MNNPGKENPYDTAFYTWQSDKSYQSANCVLPMVLSIVPAKSAIDVGCGVGTWASKLIECGVTDVLGMDGDYINRELLRIPQEYFQPWDLSKPIKMNRKFDLAICLEVAEHLPAHRAESLVEDLLNLAPVILFSAAIPGQGGVNHINERYLSYWVKLFSARDYVLLDIIRPTLWNDERCDWWYRQNTVLFVHKDNPLSRLRITTGIDYIHPQLYDQMLEAREASSKPTLGYLLRSFPGSFIRSIQSRTQRFSIQPDK